MPGLAQWLEGQHIQFRSNASTQAAEELPMELIRPVHEMKDGDILVLPRNSGFVVSLLETSQPMPLSEDQAKPAIEQFLQNRWREQTAVAEIKRLRNAATIEYVAPFVKPPDQE
jgi:hypothetical protein